jgi:radical SAM superfamily enzyme YgiQ (UPF0313 family)
LEAVPGLRFRRGNHVVDTGLAPLLTEEEVQALPQPAQDAAFGRAIEAADGVAHFMFTRGCPFSCSYCSIEAFNRLLGFKLRTRTVDQSLAQIDDALSRFPIRMIGFDDDILTLRPAWFDAFMRRYRDEIGTPFMANVRVGTVKDDQLRLFKEAGCALLQIGIESGDPFIREKVLGRRMSNEAIIAFFRRAQGFGLETMSFNMVGLPYETPEAFQRTIEINAAVHPNMAGLHVFYPYKGTRAWEMCEREGWVGREDDAFVERAGSILDMPAFPREEIERCAKGFYRGIREAVQRREAAEAAERSSAGAPVS